MTFLPIVERELRIAARRNATYRNRALAAALAMAVAMVMLLFGRLASAPARAGAAVFHVLAFFTAVFCAFEGIRKTADALSEEKREGTLGLLFLTDLKGYDVVLGKLVALSLNSLYGLIAILPILALPLMIGGVTPDEFWRLVLALVNLLFFSLCTGLLVSTWNRDDGPAMSQTFLLLGVMLFAPLWSGIAQIKMLSPIQAYGSAFALDYSRGPQDYWHSIQAVQATSWTMLLIASLAIPHLCQDRGRRTTRWPWQKPRSINTPQRLQLRAKQLDLNPLFWLANRNTKQLWFAWTLPIVMAVFAAIGLYLQWREFLPVFIGCAFLINFMFKMRVAAQACRGFAEARRNNALEILLSTPLTVNEILSGQFRALQHIFLWPAVALVGIEFITLCISLVAESLGLGRRDFGLPISMIFAMVYAAMFFLDLGAVAWAGMWFGLSSKKESQAVFKTILLALVLPLASFFMCWFGLPFFIGVPIFWISWGIQKLRSDFRLIAAQRYTPPSGTAGWMPAPVRPNPPPLPLK